jgi:uncharacterized phiE125 gp8 family phage protein
MVKSTIEVVSAPAYEPISLALFKSWFRIDADDTNHDTVLTLLRQAMREDAENLTNRAFVSRQLRLTLDNWPLHHQYGAKIDLPFPPLISVESLKYIDSDGDLQTLDAADYVVYDQYEPGFIIPAWGESWPTIRALPNAVQVVFTAGYASGSPSDEVSNQEVLPAKLKLWMAAKANTLNEFREQILAGTLQQIPRNFTDGLLDSLVVGTRLF